MVDCFGKTERKLLKFGAAKNAELAAGPAHLSQAVLAGLPSGCLDSSAVYHLRHLHLLEPVKLRRATKAGLPMPLFMRGNYGHLMGGEGHLHGGARHLMRGISPLFCILGLF